MGTVTITFDDNFTPGGAVIKVEPDLNILEAAAKTTATPLTPAQVYALGALNAVKAYSKNKETEVAKFKMIGKRKPHFRLMPVSKVTLTLHDRDDGGVACDCVPPFSTLLSMYAGGSEISEVHAYAMVAGGKIFLMNKKANESRGKYN